MTKPKEIPRSHLHSIHFEEEIKQSDAVFSRSRACRAATGGTEEASFTGKVSNVFRCVKPETIVQVPFKSTYLPHFLIHFDAC